MSKTISVSHVHYAKINKQVPSAAYAISRSISKQNGSCSGRRIRRIRIYGREFDSFRLVEWQQTQANVLRDMPNWRLYWTENEIGNWSTIIRFSVPGKLSSLFVSRLFQFRSWSKRELAHSSVGCLLHSFLIDTNTHKPIEMCRFFWELSAFLSIGTSSGAIFLFTKSKMDHSSESY